MARLLREGLLKHFCAFPFLSSHSSVSGVGYLLIRREERENVKRQKSLWRARQEERLAPAVTSQVSGWTSLPEEQSRRRGKAAAWSTEVTSGSLGKMTPAPHPPPKAPWGSASEAGPHGPPETADL